MLAWGTGSLRYQPAGMAWLNMTSAETRGGAQSLGPGLWAAYVLLVALGCGSGLAGSDVPARRYRLRCRTDLIVGTRSMQTTRR